MNTVDSTFRILPRRGGLLAALVLSGGLFAASSAQAVVVVNTEPGTVFETAGLTGFETTGADMAGMAVTALFDDASMELVNWAATGASSGAADGSDWSLSQSGDTFGAAWTLSNTTGRSMLGLIINGVPGDTVFDIDWPGTGTDGSANGNSFDMTGGPAGLDITATYRNLVAIGAAPPVGDLFTELELEFTSAGGFRSGGEDLTFLADTDNAAVQGDLVPRQPVPEPLTLGLFGLGMLGAACARRRR